MGARSESAFNRAFGKSRSPGKYRITYLDQVYESSTKPHVDFLLHLLVTLFSVQHTTVCFLHWTHVGQQSCMRTWRENLLWSETKEITFYSSVSGYNTPLYLTAFRPLRDNCILSFAVGQENVRQMRRYRSVTVRATCSSNQMAEHGSRTSCLFINLQTKFTTENLA